LFAYNIAKHYGISLTEVYNMSEEIFRQSLVWAMVYDAEEEKQAEESRVRSNTESNDIVKLDYSFLQEDDF
jgi:hypothetical protein|tara:strand:- start:4099 stop:4311 length:213 start_codon:yes stop_codon:yes gene_type:complete